MAAPDGQKWRTNEGLLSGENISKEGELSRL